MKKGKKDKKKLNDTDNRISYTVCGEFFPEAYPAFRSRKWSHGMEDPLDTEMRLFCSCTRWAFNRLQENKSREELKKQAQQVFGLNSRCSDDAILKAKAVIESQKELLKLEIEDTEAKLAHARKKLGRAEKHLDEAIKKNNLVKIEKFKRTVHGRKARVKKLADKLADLQAHQHNGTIPAVVFGGRSLWKRVCKGRATREEWRQARQDRLYSRGDETKGGNPNIKISYQNGDFRLSVAISHLSEQKGTDIKGRPVMTRAPRVTGKLWLPDKHRLKVLELLSSGAPYTGYRRAYLIGVSAKVVVDIAKTLGKPIALEKLDFGKDRLDTNKEFNRMAANFPFKKMVEAVIRRAFKEGVGVKPVWPAHTSTIGYYKHMDRYGIIIHHAAALVIARRAIGFRERITNELRQKVQVLKEKLNQKANSLPEEGKGMTRKVKQLFKRLDRKIPIQNGLTCFQQESFYSVWHDLKQLALLNR